MSLRRPVRAALAVLVSALLAVVAPAPGEAKVLRTNLRADPAMVDPITYSELVAGDVMKNLYEGFTEIDKDGNVIPALAVRWEANPDNRGFRFHLRKGVKFHSGREFTASSRAASPRLPTCGTGGLPGSVLVAESAPHRPRHRGRAAPELRRHAPGGHRAGCTSCSTRWACPRTT
jgi:ABC-type transport system substrate-binding protein